MVGLARVSHEDLGIRGSLCLLKSRIEPRIKVGAMIFGGSRIFRKVEQDIMSYLRDLGFLRPLEELGLVDTWDFWDHTISLHDYSSNATTIDETSHSQVRHVVDAVGLDRLFFSRQDSLLKTHRAHFVQRWLHGRRICGLTTTSRMGGGPPICSLKTPAPAQLCVLLFHALKSNK